MLIDKNVLSFKNQLFLAKNKFKLTYFFFINTVLLLTRRTFFNYLWLIFKPAVPLTVYSIVFGMFMGLNNEIKYPYLLFLLSGYVPWSLFDDCTYWTTRTYEANKKIIKKISLPFLLIPIGSSITGLVMTLTGFTFLIFATFYFSFNGQFDLNLNFLSILICAISLLTVYIFSLGLGFILCIFNARFRDTKFTIKIILSGWLYLTPVMYPLEKVPENFHFLYLIINPIAAPILNFRNSYLHNMENVIYDYLIINFFLSVILLILGVFFYLRSIRNGIIIK